MNELTKKLISFVYCFMEEIDKRYISINEFTIKYRNLPHWQLPGAVYFITFRTHHLILNSIEMDLVSETILFNDKITYDLISFVIMPDHVHLILRTIELSDGTHINLSKILHSIKSYSAKLINKLNEIKGRRIWQHESFDRIIRDEKELYEKIVYIYNNPIKKGLSNENELYKWYYLKGLNDVE